MPPKGYKKKSSNEYVNNQTDCCAIYLVIVESPSKCTKIESFLGSNYKCIASKGHIRTIDGLKNIDTKNNYEIKFSIIDEKKSHITFMRDCISKFSKQHIILATDDDREGEAIAWHICDLFGLDTMTTKRIIFHGITKPAILKAIQNPITVNMDMVKAAHARQVLDILVGFKVSPFLWKHIYNNKKNGLSAGRCQTPALRLVYENEKLINSSEIETKYKTTGVFFSKQIPFYLNHDFLEEEKVREFLELSKTFSHFLSIGKTKESMRNPPKPFNTSMLLQTASNVLHMSPKETMNLCQQLYQAGHITYMRTENTKYSADFLPKVKEYVINRWKSEKYLGDLEKITNLDETNPHEAIRVTHIEHPFIIGLEGRIHTLYKLIWRNTLGSCMAPAKYNCTTVTISAPQELHYSNIVEVPVFLGWKVIEEREPKDGSDSSYETAISSTDQNSSQGLLLFFQSIQPHTSIPVSKIESIISVSNKHSHYTESSLIQRLEDLGIGRPSTFATIVDTIQERGYVKKKDVEGIVIDCNEYVFREQTIEKITKTKTFGNEKNKLVIQPIGIASVEFLVEHFQPLFDYDYTKKMEDDLDKVTDKINDTNNTKVVWHSICLDCENLIEKLSKPVKKMKKPVYTIKSRDGTIDYELCVHQYGTSLKQISEKGDVSYIPVNPKIKIDIESVKCGKYIAEELFDIKQPSLGKYKDIEIEIKKGKYGLYAKWGDKNTSLKSIGKSAEYITIDDIIPLIDPDYQVDSILHSKSGDIDPNTPRLPPPPKNPNILRILNEDLSIRKGKYGPYIYFMQKGAKKPDFFKLAKYKTTFATCDETELIKWIGETYNICVTYIG
jgi:DNA topoisomerase-1